MNNLQGLNNNKKSLGIRDRRRDGSVRGGIRLQGIAGCWFGRKNVLVCRVSTSSDRANSWKGREWSAFLQRSLSVPALRFQKCCKDSTFILVPWCWGQAWLGVAMFDTSSAWRTPYTSFPSPSPLFLPPMKLCQVLTAPCFLLASPQPVQCSFLPGVTHGRVCVPIHDFALAWWVLLPYHGSSGELSLLCLLNWLLKTYNFKAVWLSCNQHSLVSHCKDTWCLWHGVKNGRKSEPP